jgi:hypothetical protein
MFAYAVDIRAQVEMEWERVQARARPRHRPSSTPNYFRRRRRRSRRGAATQVKIESNVRKKIVVCQFEALKPGANNEGFKTFQLAPPHQGRRLGGFAHR